MFCALRFVTEMTSLVNYITKRRFIALLAHVADGKTLGYIYGPVLVAHRDSFRLRKRTVDRIDTIYLPRFCRVKQQIMNISPRSSENDRRHTSQFDGRKNLYRNHLI